MCDKVIDDTNTDVVAPWSRWLWVKVDCELSELHLHLVELLVDFFVHLIVL